MLFRVYCSGTGGVAPYVAGTRTWGFVSSNGQEVEGRKSGACAVAVLRLAQDERMSDRSEAGCEREPEAIPTPEAW